MNWLCDKINAPSRGDAVSAARTLMKLAHSKLVIKEWPWFSDARQVAKIVAPKKPIPAVDFDKFWTLVEETFDVGLSKIEDLECRDMTMAILRAERGLRAQDVAVLPCMDYETVPRGVKYSEAKETHLWFFRTKSKKLTAGSKSTRSEWEEIVIEQEPNGKSAFAKSPRYQKTYFGVWLEEYDKRVRALPDFPTARVAFNGKLVHRGQLFLPVSRFQRRLLWKVDGVATGQDSSFQSGGIGNATFLVLQRAGVVTAAGLDGAGVRCTPKHFRHFAATYFDSLLVKDNFLTQEDLVKYMRHSGAGSLTSHLADDVPLGVRERMAARRVNKLPHFLIRI